MIVNVNLPKAEKNAQMCFTTNIDILTLNEDLKHVKDDIDAKLQLSQRVVIYRTTYLPTLRPFMAVK